MSSGIQYSNLFASDHEAALHWITSGIVTGFAHLTALVDIAISISEVLIFHQFGQEKLHLTRTCQE